MKYIFTTLFFIASITWSLHAQTFTDLNSHLPSLESGAAAWCDYDKGGDLDMVLEGFSSVFAEQGFIFRNDNGIMTIVDSSIIRISSGSVNWCDYDNDGDQDLLINGQ